MLNQQQIEQPPIPLVAQPTTTPEPPCKPGDPGCPKEPFVKNIIPSKPPEKPYDCKKSPELAKCKHPNPPHYPYPTKCGKWNNWCHEKKWCDWHDCRKHHHDHHHDHNKDHHNYSTKNYYYYYTNDYSNNHATVILQPDYSHTNNYHDIRLVIGFDFDTIINFAGKPENFVVTGLYINKGDQFNVCMKNENDSKTNCVTSHLQDENKAVYVDIRVP